jgi:hypothetical protein
MLFGPAYKGIPLAAATAIALTREHGRDVPWAYNRKEVKDHGEGGVIVGAPLSGRVLIVDDVITAGTAVRESLGLIRDAGATVAGVLVALDRQERGQGERSAVQELAREHGVPVIGVPSGMQPRASVVYMTLAAIECAALCGAAPSLRSEIETARDVLEQLAESSGADDIARALDETIPIVHGAGPTAAVARRWKTQLNENAKLAAFASEVPEANHNEIEGWAHGLDQAPLSAIFLHAPDLHPRLEQRMELTAERLSELGAPVVRVDARGENPVAHVLSLVMTGDPVSVSLAELAGIDPTPVAAIEGFKSALGT